MRDLEGALCAKLTHREADRIMFGSPNRRDYSEAKALCHACPVRMACLEDALAVESTTALGQDAMYGIRGGLTPTERRTLLHHRAAS